tara:strand:+ start:2154 stop:2732 length:579 start_codon:yes stop_codon:yes gene_type:complete
MISSGLARLGSMYKGQVDRDFAGELREVQDPDKAFAQILRQDYNDYIGNFRQYEQQLLGMLDDTTLIDRTRENTARQNQIAAEIQERNLDRYGGAGMSPAQRQAQQRNAQLAGQRSLAGSVNNARVRQREINQALTREIIGIGQGVNARALSGLATGAANEVARQGAYKNARAQYRGGLMGAGASILAAFSI